MRSTTSQTSHMRPTAQVADRICQASVSFNLSPRRYNPQSIIRIPWNPPNGALKLSASLEFRLDFLKVVSGEFSRKFDHFVACYGRGMLSCHQNHAYDAILSSKPCLRWHTGLFSGFPDPAQTHSQAEFSNTTLSSHRGTSPIRKRPPARTPLGPP
jgi:hypothetical protein